MRIGFTYDLRDDYLRQGYSEEDTAEFDAPETIDAIEAALQTLGHVVDRVGGIKSLTTRLAGGDRWDLVFNYAEGMFGLAREAQVPALLDAFQIPYTFSDGLVFALTLHKGLTKRVVRDLAIPTPDFAVVSQISDVEHVRLPFPLFVKPIASGSSVGISAASHVTDSSALANTCRHLLDRFRQPVLVETFLPGRELTIGIAGTGSRARVLGVMEVVFTPEAEAHGYSYANKKQVNARYRIVDDAAAVEAAAIALRAWNGLGCRDAGRVDCRCDSDGRPQFLEVNPLAGLHPVLGDIVILADLVGVSYEGLIASIVTSACERDLGGLSYEDGDPPGRLKPAPPTAQAAPGSLSVAVIYNPVELGGDAVVRGVIDGARDAHDTIQALGHRVRLLRVDEGIRPFIDALDAAPPDVVFNLCEGYRESSAGEYGVAALLELLGLPYTGSGALALGLALNKPLAKEVFIARGIPTPRFAVYREMPARLPPLTFPLMLKLAAEDASLGITADNVVADEASALERLQQLLDEYRAPVMVEEFIDGREFTVALLDGRPLLVEEIEILVEPRIVGFRAKWESGSAEYDGTRPVFAPDITSDQRDGMMTLAVRVWDAIGMRDYARVDFRMDAEGRVFVLEANPNPDISAGSGYRRSLAVANISYRDFIATLLENARGRSPNDPPQARQRT